MDQDDTDEEEGMEDDVDVDSDGNEVNLSARREHRPVALPSQLDVERQKNLEEALLLQMDMQKRLHEQLEVCIGHAVGEGWGKGSQCITPHKVNVTLRTSASARSLWYWCSGVNLGVLTCRHSGNCSFTSRPTVDTSAA